MKNETIVIVGNGIAGNTAAAAIRKANDSVGITMISQEPLPLYSACALPNYLSGEIPEEALFLKSLRSYSEDNINTVFNEKVARIDPKKKMLVLDKNAIPYDKLIIATGSEAIIPPVDGRDKKGVFALKSFADMQNIHNYPAQKAVVVGSGPIGVEASIALKNRGCEVYLVEMLNRVLPKAFDEGPAGRIRDFLSSNGIQVFTDEKLIAVLGNGKVETVRTSERKIRCDMVIFAVGMMPHVELAKSAGIETGPLGGIRVDNKMRSSVADIFACGDCVETTDFVSGRKSLNLLWHNAEHQGQIAGCNCMGHNKLYSGSMNVTVLNIFDVPCASVGATFNDLAKSKSVDVIEKESVTHYLRLLIAEGKLCGIQSVGETKGLGLLHGIVRRKDDIDSIMNMREVGDHALLMPWRYNLLKINQYQR